VTSRINVVESAISIKKGETRMKRIESNEIKTVAREMGAHLVGIGSGECVEITPTRRGPSNVLPEASSVVVFAKRMLAGSIESPREEVVTSQNLTLYQELDRISYALGCFLEERGHRAATIPAYSPVEMTSVTKGFVGVVSLRHVAQAAGLGNLGKNNLLITAELGPRIRLGGVVTTARMDPDEPLTEDFCSDCNACIAACPVNALSEPGKTHTGRCVRQVLPYGLSGLIKYLTEGLDGSKEAMKASFKEAHFWNIYQSLQLGLQYGCHACINACPIGLKPS
jgi:epoxyqueuosine reductase QueG